MATMVKTLAYKAVLLIVDTVDDITAYLGFRTIARPASEFPPHDGQELSDSAVLELFRSNTPFNGSAVVKITAGLVVKPAQDIDEDIEDPSEAQAMKLVFSTTTIPVPRVHRIITVDEDRFIVMDLIPGQPLSIVWPSLSFLRRVSIGITLRRYIRQLRAIRHRRPGPLAGRWCYSPVFGDVGPPRGPFQSSKELAAFFNDRARVTASPAPPPSPDIFDGSTPLVLTHQDLNQSNLIVGHDGRLWVIDWSWAGFYPRWFEFLDMKRQMRDAGPMWEAMIAFICDPYFEQETWINKMGPALSSL